MSERKKIVLVSGATGMVGRALCEDLESKGHTVRRLSRKEGADVRWDVEAGTIDSGAMTDVDVVVHLAGEPVAQRWTEETKAKMLSSRVDSAQLLVREILKQPIPPDYITASGINYYGYDCGADVTETSPLGRGFLAEVCREWEAAAEPLAQAQVRAVYARIGMVLSSQGGAFTKLLPPFRLGLGGRIASGQQHMSWISLPDVVQILALAVDNQSISGPVNVVAPQPITNAAFTKSLGSVLSRPTCFPMPKIAVQAIFGKMGLEVLCSDVGVVPQVLLDRGFEWEYTDLGTCFRACLEEVI